MSKSGFLDLCCFGSEKSRSPSPPPPPSQTGSSPPRQAVTKENGNPSQTASAGQTATEGHADQSTPNRQVSSPAAGDCSVGDRLLDGHDGTKAVGSEDVRLAIDADDAQKLPAPVPSQSASEPNPTPAGAPSGQPAVKSPATSLPADSDLSSPKAIESLLIEAREALASGKLGPEMEAQISSLVARLEAVTNRLESVAVKSSSVGSADSDAVSPFVVAFDEIIGGPIKQFMDFSEKIGDEVKTQAQMVKEAIDAQRQFLVIASRSKSPSQDTLMKLLEPTSKKLQEIEEFASRNRKSQFFNHLSAISSSVPALGWVTVTPTPAPFVKEMTDSGQFYLNRVLRDFKDKDKTHVEWTAAWKSALNDLHNYIKQYHTTGLTWNPQGGDASQATATTNAAPVPPPPAGGGAPPPPPPGPPPANLLDDNKEAGNDTDKQRNALFAEISKGADITKGLRKVTDDMKTHKNPDLRLQSPQPYKPKPSPKPAVKMFGARKVESVKPPKCVLENKKWVVEYQVNNKNLVITDTDIKQTVYIFKCDNSTIQVKGKVNSIAMDSCKKTALLFDDVVSSVDFINCVSVQAQVTGTVKTINIDKTDGCMMYLSKDSVNANIVTAKSSEMNVLVPDDSGEFKEFALPEQFRSLWNGKRFVTEPTDLIG